MNKLCTFTSLYCSLLALFLSQGAVAGLSTKITVTCPKVSENSSALLNYGNYIAGNGTVKVNSDSPSKEWFSGSFPLDANIPTDLTTGGYAHSGVYYLPTTGDVRCLYKSSKGYNGFLVVYRLSNATGGMVIKENNGEITIKLGLGLK